MCPWQYETKWIGQRGVCHIYTIPPPIKVMHDLCHSLNRARTEYAWFEFSSVFHWHTNTFIFVVQRYSWGIFPWQSWASVFWLFVYCSQCSWTHRVNLRLSCICNRICVFCLAVFCVATMTATQLVEGSTGGRAMSGHFTSPSMPHVRPCAASHRTAMTPPSSTLSVILIEESVYFPPMYTTLILCFSLFLLGYFHLEEYISQVCTLQ